MAIIDPDRNVVIVRIVYDGPPLSGKTTSIKALHNTLANTGELFIPQDEKGKTLLFDWLDYEGGTFGGRPIACQIVTVPGQPLLRQRREYLLETADVVVFVVDAQPSQLPAGLLYYQNLQTLLAKRQQIPAQIIIQANKQDKPDALTAAQLAFFFPDDCKMTESSANQNRGIRETFVFAVRLALDRLKQQMDCGQQVMNTANIQSQQNVLAALQALELTPQDTDQVLDQLLEFTAYS